MGKITLNIRRTLRLHKSFRRMSQRGFNKIPRSGQNEVDKVIYNRRWDPDNMFWFGSDREDVIIFKFDYV